MAGTVVVSVVSLVGRTFLRPGSQFGNGSSSSHEASKQGDEDEDDREDDEADSRQ